MELRFDVRELPETSQVYFTYAKQSGKESLIEWADRILTMATRAYPDLSDGQIFNHAIFKFCEGCLDKAAGHYTINLRPATMEDAIDKIRWYQHTDSIMYGKPKRDARSIRAMRYRYDDSNESSESSDDEPLSVAKASFPQNMQKAQTKYI